MRVRKPSFYVRKFINKPGHHTVASILATIERGAYPTFILSDCDRTIKLDFTAHSTKARANSLYKAQALIDILTEFKKALEKEFEAHPVTTDRDDY